MADFGGSDKQHVMPKGFVRGEVIQKGAQKEKDREREREKGGRRKDVDGEDREDDPSSSLDPAAAAAAVTSSAANSTPAAVSVTPVSFTLPEKEESYQDRIYKPAKLLLEEEEEEAKARAKAASPHEESPTPAAAISDAGKKKKRELDNFLEEIKRCLLLLILSWSPICLVVKNLNQSR